MDFQSAMETFAEAWVAANTGKLPLPPASSQQQPVVSSGAPISSSSVGSLHGSGMDVPSLNSLMDSQQLVSGRKSFSLCVFLPCKFHIVS